MTRNLTRRTVLKSTGAAGAALTLPGLKGHVSAQDATPSPGGTFVYGTSPLPWPAVHPLGSLSSTQWVVIQPTFLRLIYGQNWGDGVNPDFAPEFDAGVAESATEIEVNRVWEFKLRTDVTWHDGEPVTADDVIFGIWLALNKNSGATGNAALRPILGADALIDNGAGQLEPPYDVVVRAPPSSTKPRFGWNSSNRPPTSG